MRFWSSGIVTLQNDIDREFSFKKLGITFRIIWLVGDSRPFLENGSHHADVSLG